MENEISFFDSRLKVFFSDENKIKNNIENINFNLLYHQYPRYDKDNGYQFYQRDRENPQKDKWLLGNKPTETDKYKFFNTNFIQRITTKHYQNIQKLLADSDYAEMDLTQDWRMNVGLGNESVYEVGMTLHHIYGFPYIPGTAIKGICRQYANENGYKDDVIDIFGSEDTDNPKRGKVIFFDAMPTSEVILSPDIMNNHYPDYYSGGDEIKPPADWQSPRPIFFLTVKETQFKFVLGLKDEKDQKILKTAKEILVNALSDYGVGSKTMVGYGTMSNGDQKENGESDNSIDCEVKPMPKAQFLNENTQKFNPKKRYTMQGVITKSGKPNLMNVYIKEGNIQEKVKVDRVPNPLAIGTVVEVEVEVNNKQKVVQASLKKIIK